MNVLRMLQAGGVVVAMALVIGGSATSTSLASVVMPPPDVRGPYEVGFTTFSGTVGSGLPTKVTVWYPHCTAGISECSANTPGTRTYAVTLFVPPNPTIVVPSPLGAIENASVEQASFPLVVWAHGGPAFAPSRERMRLGNFQLMEHLASHGFVAASYERNTAGLCSNELAGPRDVITQLLTRNATAGDLLEGRIDPNKIGAMAHSAGGAGAYGLLTGADPSSSLPLGLSPDPRVKALAVTEAIHDTCGITTARKQSVTNPVMVIGGSPDRYGPSARTPFNQLTSAESRILVTTKTKTDNANLNADHTAYQVGDCDLTDAFRENSLARQVASLQTPLVEPLTSAFGSDPTITDPAARALAAQALFQWNNPIQPILRQRTFCNRVGTNPQGYLPIGVSSSDGLVTSSPPFEPSPVVNSTPPFTACSPVQCIPQARMDRMVKLFTVSFWKTFLEGDKRYNRFLTRGYSNSEPEATTERVDTK